MISTAAIGIPASIAATIQDNTLLRKFYDALFPRLLYRMDMTPELWAANLGERITMTRAGLMVPDITPLTPGVDVTVGSYSVEQWDVEANQYGKGIDTHMPTSYVSMASTFLRNQQQLGLHSGMTVNRLARNKLFRAYLGGEAMSLGVFASGVTQIAVSTINGFTQYIQNGRLTPVSASNPLPITFSTAEPANTVINIQAADPTDPYGPGILTLGTALSVGIAARVGVFAINRSRRQRVGGGATVDAIATNSILTLDDVIAAVARLRTNNVPTHEDGFYHAHITPAGEKQLFGDNHWQRQYQSIPGSREYTEFVVNEKVGCRFFRNNESPSTSSVSRLEDTSALARLAPEIGGEVVNNTGLPIARLIITGGGCGYEKFIDESKYITEAGVQGKIGEFAVTNGGVMIMTDRIRYVLRSPQDRLGQMVSAAWSWSGDFGIPSDQLTGDPARFKRAVVVEHVDII